MATSLHRYICIHGHFYQPPRENPWLDEVELQDSARPYHDWNERIGVECYAPNANARILDGEGFITDIVNNFERISFNMGPTLLSWMERRMPEVHAAIVEADLRGRARHGGHGPALAQVYNHMIMPLATRRDKYTQALWGLKDFQKRFGRDPEGMWLPETAVDIETLEVLAELGIRFTVAAPNQASRVRERGDGGAAAWRDVSGSRLDPTRAYGVSLPSGRDMAVFVYDGPISREVAFTDLLGRGERLKDRLMGAFTNDRPWPQLVHIATDGETFGHHHRHGEMALAYCLELLEADDSVTPTVYGHYLEKHPPQAELELFERSSWSCVHGVERWKADCGCNSGMHPGWRQDWRAPLRKAMDWLGGRLAELYEAEAAAFFADPWAARDAYAQVILDRSPAAVERFLSEQGRDIILASDRVRALKLMEMARFGQLIHTSCAWFFDELSGIETVQVIQYAVRAIQLAEELGAKGLEKQYLARLKKAPSNVFADGAEVYRRLAKPARVGMDRVAAHYAMSLLFDDDRASQDFACYQVRSRDLVTRQAGRSRMALGEVELTSSLTLESGRFRFAVVNPGDHNLVCGVSDGLKPEAWDKLCAELHAAFEMGDITRSVRALDKAFGKGLYSVEHLFRDDQRRIVGEMLEPALDDAEDAYRRTYDAAYPLMNFLHHLDMPIDDRFLDAAKVSVSTELTRLFVDGSVDMERLKALMAERERFGLPLGQTDGAELAYAVSRWVFRSLKRLMETADAEDWRLLAANLAEVLRVAGGLPVHLNLARSQNLYFRHAGALKPFPGGPGLAERKALFNRLGELLKVRVA